LKGVAPIATNKGEVSEMEIHFRDGKHPRRPTDTATPRCRQQCSTVESLVH